MTFNEFDLLWMRATFGSELPDLVRKIRKAAAKLRNGPHSGARVDWHFLLPMKPG